MKLLYAFILLMAIPTDILNEHLSKAEAENKKVLLYFSGSDWCGACLKLKKNVLETAEFQAFANEKFVTMLLDFPQKATATDPFSMADKEKLAEKYNKKGTFPLIVVLDKNGEILKEIKGYKGQSVEQIIEQLSENQ